MLRLEAIDNLLYSVVKYNMSNTGWGYFMQGNENQEELERLGIKLNSAIDCPIHYPAFGKRLFECWCGVIFPLFVVEAHNEEFLRKVHKGEIKL